MPITFSQDRPTLERHYEVFDENNNILPAVDPQFSVSDENLITIQSHTNSNAVLAHPDPHSQGIATITYSVRKGDTRLSVSEEIEVVFGEPHHIVGSTVE